MPRSSRTISQPCSVRSLHRRSLTRRRAPAGAVTGDPELNAPPPAIRAGHGRHANAGAISTSGAVDARTSVSTSAQSGDRSASSGIRIVVAGRPGTSSSSAALGLVPRPARRSRRMDTTPARLSSAMMVSVATGGIWRMQICSLPPSNLRVTGELEPSPRSCPVGAEGEVSLSPDKPYSPDYLLLSAREVAEANATTKGRKILCSDRSWSAGQERVLQANLGHAPGSRVTDRHYVTTTELARRQAIFRLPVSLVADTAVAISGNNSNRQNGPTHLAVPR
jgi:hypothetical protein